MPYSLILLYVLRGFKRISVHKTRRFRREISNLLLYPCSLSDCRRRGFLHTESIYVCITIRIWVMERMQNVR